MKPFAAQQCELPDHNLNIKKHW